MTLRPIAEVLRADQLSLIQPDVVGDADSLSDLDLLADALVEALEAQQNGVVIGPAVDEFSLRRAERSARRADGRRQHITLVLGGVA